MIKSGFLLVKKPKNITSHDVVDRLRKISGIKKVGHSGTLDPFATGLLILGIGKRATKKLSRFLKADKEYIGLLKLGAVSDTFDDTGKILKKEKNKEPTKDEVKKALKSFLGEINQTPPLFSAQKIKGKPLYRLARKGIKIKPRAKKAKINKIEILNYSFPYLKIKVKCSSGTYIRSLANDIGKTIGCGAYLEELKRTKIGLYSLEKAVELSKINKENWQKFLYKL